MAENKATASFVQNKMNIIIRADASMSIGIGHVTRCLTLADELTRAGANVSFICRQAAGNLIRLLEKKGYVVYRLPADISMEIDSKMTEGLLKGPARFPEWLIVDHYDIDSLWESSLRRFVKNIMIIDDLADRPHDCDLLLDQNLYQNMKSRYDSLVPRDCRKLLGPEYALLRLEFRQERKKLRERSGEVRRIMIFFGGSDLSNETSKALDAIVLLNRPHIAVDVVIGTNNPHRHHIEKLASAMPQTDCHFQVDNMAKLMTAADIYVGAAGSTAWERCCLGLPSLVITVAENQVQVTKDLAASGFLHFMGKHNEIDQRGIKESLQFFLSNPELLKQYSQNSSEPVDAFGVERCVHEMQQLSV